MIQRLTLSAIGLATIGASLACSTGTTSPAEKTGTAVDPSLQDGGPPDLLWLNTATGQLEAWLLNGTQVNPNPVFLSQTCGDGCLSPSLWQVVDTRSNTVLWWNRTTGVLRTWSFDDSGNVNSFVDATQTCGVQDGCLNASHSWRPIGRVQLQASSPCPPCGEAGCRPCSPTSGASGVLWYDSISGTVRVWVFALASSGDVVGSFDLTEVCGPSDACSLSWSPKLTADFDSDGITDLLWWNAGTGQVKVWLLDSPATLSPIPATVTPKNDNFILSLTCGASESCSSDWRPVGAADVNGDGNVDLLWHNYQGIYLDLVPGILRTWLLDGEGNVTGTQDLSQQCGALNGCSPPWTALGYVVFP